MGKRRMFFVVGTPCSNNTFSEPSWRTHGIGEGYMELQYRALPVVPGPLNTTHRSLRVSHSSKKVLSDQFPREEVWEREVGVGWKWRDIKTFSSRSKLNTVWYIYIRIRQGSRTLIVRREGCDGRHCAHFPPRGEKKKHRSNFLSLPGDVRNSTGPGNLCPALNRVDKSCSRIYQVFFSEK